MIQFESSLFFSCELFVVSQRHSRDSLRLSTMDRVTEDNRQIRKARHFSRVLGGAWLVLSRLAAKSCDFQRTAELHGDAVRKGRKDSSLGDGCGDAECWSATQPGRRSDLSYTWSHHALSMCVLCLFWSVSPVLFTSRLKLFFGLIVVWLCVPFHFPCASYGGADVHHETRRTARSSDVRQDH